MWMDGILDLYDTIGHDFRTRSEYTIAIEPAGRQTDRQTIKHIERHLFGILVFGRLLTWKACHWENSASRSQVRVPDDGEAFQPCDERISDPCTADRKRDRWCPERERGWPEPQTVVA